MIGAGLTNALAALQVTKKIVIHREDSEDLHGHECISQTSIELST